VCRVRDDFVEDHLTEVARVITVLARDSTESEPIRPGRFCSQIGKIVA
jgi:hypothetical protein